MSDDDQLGVHNNWGFDSRGMETVKCEWGGEGKCGMEWWEVEPLVEHVHSGAFPSLCHLSPLLRSRSLPSLPLPPSRCSFPPFAPSDFVSPRCTDPPPPSSLAVHAFPDDPYGAAGTGQGKKGSTTSYICDWAGCPRRGKTQGSKFALVAHLRSHTGEKPFHCPKPGAILFTLFNFVSTSSVLTSFPFTPSSPHLFLLKRNLLRFRTLNSALLFPPPPPFPLPHSLTSALHPLPLPLPPTSLSSLSPSSPYSSLITSPSTECDKSFTRTDALQKHMRVQHNENPVVSRPSAKASTDTPGGGGGAKGKGKKKRGARAASDESAFDGAVGGGGGADDDFLPPPGLDSAGGAGGAATDGPITYSPDEVHAHSLQPHLSQEFVGYVVVKAKQAYLMNEHEGLLGELEALEAREADLRAEVQGLVGGVMRKELGCVFR